jgi:hypothetical protein
MLVVRATPSQPCDHEGKQPTCYCILLHCSATTFYRLGIFNAFLIYDMLNFQWVYSAQPHCKSRHICVYNYTNVWYKRWTQIYYVDVGLERLEVVAFKGREMA